METRVGGIAGKVSFYGAAVTDAEISALIESVPHRSPSGAKVRTFETGALVSLFLQTERNEYEVCSAPGDGLFAAVIHGDIHNSEEVLSQLGREQTADQISTEQLIVASYIKWGDQCPLYLLQYGTPRGRSYSAQEMLLASNLFTIFIKMAYLYLDQRLIR